MSTALAALAGTVVTAVVISAIGHLAGIRKALERIADTLERQRPAPRPGIRTPPTPTPDELARRRRP